MKSACTTTTSKILGTFDYVILIVKYVILKDGEQIDEIQPSASIAANNILLAVFLPRPNKLIIPRQIGLVYVKVIAKCVNNDP